MKDYESLPPKRKTKPLTSAPKNASVEKKVRAAERISINLELKLLKEQKKLEELKKLQQIKNNDHTVVTSEEINQFSVHEQKELNNREIIFQPNPGPQTEFLESNEDEVLFAGARGGGKSFALIIDPIRFCDNKNFRALIIRKTMPELRQLIGWAKDIYSQAYPGTKWREQEKIFVFPSGAKIEFGYLETETDVDRYRGQEYTWIGVDEITLFGVEESIDRLLGSLRTVDASLKTYFRCCIDKGDVLTTTGWKDIKDVKIDEYVYSLTSVGELVAKRVYNSIAFDVDEELVRIKKQTLHMSMTQDHRIVHKIGDKFVIDRWNKITKDNINVARTCNSYKAVGYAGYTFNNMSPENWLAFLGIYLAEGSISWKVINGNYTVCVTQCKLQNFEVITNLLKLTGLKWWYCVNGDFKCHNKELYTYLKQFGKSKDKYVPLDILQTATREQLQILFEWLMLGDGHWQSKTNGQYTTTSVRLRDAVLEIGLKLGYKTQFSTKLRENVNHNTCYDIYLNKNTTTTVISKKQDDIKLERYIGKVYCLSVEDTENFVIRQGDKIYITGNTSNPNGPGRAWVKRRFVDRAASSTRYESILQTSLGEMRKTGKWINSMTEDNPVLLNKNPQYLAWLESLPEGLRKAWRYGDWNVAEGVAFPDFFVPTHVVKPFEIPHTWLKFRACDWGFTSMAVCLWFAADEDSNIYIYREYKTKLVDAPRFAGNVLQLEKGEKVRYGIIDGSVGDQRGISGPTVDEQMRMQGCVWRYADKSPGSRIAGKNLVHKYLSLNEFTQRPTLYVFDTCKELIEELSSLPLDRNDAEDVDTDCADHAYDALRYGLMSRPNTVSAFDSWAAMNPNPRPIVVDIKFGY